MLEALSYPVLALRIFRVTLSIDWRAPILSRAGLRQYTLIGIAATRNCRENRCSLTSRIGSKKPSIHAYHDVIHVLCLELSSNFSWKTLRLICIAPIPPWTSRTLLFRSSQRKHYKKNSHIGLGGGERSLPSLGAIIKKALPIQMCLRYILFTKGQLGKFMSSVGFHLYMYT